MDKCGEINKINGCHLRLRKTRLLRLGSQVPAKRGGAAVAVQWFAETGAPGSRGRLAPPPESRPAPAAPALAVASRGVRGGPLTPRRSEGLEGKFCSGRGVGRPGVGRGAGIPGAAASGWEAGLGSDFRRRRRLRLPGAGEGGCCVVFAPPHHYSSPRPSEDRGLPGPRPRVG